MYGTCSDMLPEARVTCVFFELHATRARIPHSNTLALVRTRVVSCVICSPVLLLHVHPRLLLRPRCLAYRHTR